MNGQNAKIETLYAQIEEVCRQFKQIRGEAAGIAQNSQMPESAQQLNDVLESSEAAAMVILEAATAIGSVVEESGVPAGAKEKITEQIGRIYEAASFQDIGGQRIKKVLEHLSALEAQLQRLSDTARGQQAPEAAKDPLLNGPQLAAVAPSQDDIDKLFGSG